MRSEVRELSERYGLRVDPDARIEELPVGVQQRVEIIKALVREAQVLILDEPTSVLTPGETEELFTIMRQLRADGRSIIFISHKLGKSRRSPTSSPSSGAARWWASGRPPRPTRSWPR